MSAASHAIHKGPATAFSEHATVIRIRPEFADEAFALLLGKGQVQALPKESYVVGPEHIHMLDDAGVKYDVLRSE